MKDWEWKNILVGLFLIVILFVVPGVMVREGMKIRDNLRQVGLPKIEINLADTELDEVKENGKDVVYSAKNLKLTSGDEILNFTDVELKGRGNVTWEQIKKPFQIKLQQKADLLGLGKRRKWILLANYVDPTNLRTDAAFYIERMLGEKFAYEGEFVELFINGDFEGLYYLTRGIEIGKNAVDLRDPLGVLVELDNAYALNEPQYYISGNGEQLTVKDVKTKDSVNAAMEDFLVNFNKLEFAIKQKDFETISQLIDVESFARYYLLEEFIVNLDAYFTSQYFYKDGSEDKIHAGPAWDFDIALNLGGGIAPDFNYTKDLGRSEGIMVGDQYVNRSRLLARLMRISEFRAEVKKVFIEKMSGHKQELLDYITERAVQINQSALKDGEKWNKKDFVQEVERMLEWINKRYDYFEEWYGQGS